MLTGQKGRWPGAFDNAWPNRSRGATAPTSTHYDFAVSKRPLYIRGSGPPLKKPTPIPSDRNKDGIILDLLEVAPGELRYVVGSKGRPELRVSVQMMDILDWVSPKTYEDWNWERLKEQEKNRKQIGMHWKARRKMEGDESRENIRNRLPGLGTQGMRIAVEIDGAKMVPGLGLVLHQSPTGPGKRKRQSSTTDELAVSQPSLITTPNKQQRGLAEIVIVESESEEYDEDMLDEEGRLLPTQLKWSSANPPENLSRSTSTTPPLPDISARIPASKSKSHVGRFSSPSLKNRLQVQVPLSRSFSPPSNSEDPNMSNKQVPSSSSLQFKPTKESSPAKSSPSSTSKPKNPTTQTNLRRFFLSGQSLNPKPRKKTPTPTPPPVIADNEEVSGEEWEVERILSDELRHFDDGSHIRYYLIKWVGEWDDTWEPATNVGSAAVKEYKARKQAQKSKANASEKNGHVKQPKRKREREIRERDEQDYEGEGTAGSKLENKKGRELQKSQKGMKENSSTTSPDPLGNEDAASSSRPKKRLSLSPAISSGKVNLQELFGDDDDDDDVDTEMVDAPPARHGTETSEEGMFFRDRGTPAARTFGIGSTPVTGSTTNGRKGKNIIRARSLQIGSSASPVSTPSRPVEDGNKIYIVSSGDSGTEEEDDDEDELI